MIRDTSIEAFKAIQAEGLLADLEWLVYETLFFYGPLSSGELWNEYHPTLQRQSLTPRFAGLQKKGVIQSIEKRPCRFTGRLVWTWDVTSRLPIKSDSPRKIPCKHCNGKGFIVEQQFKLF